MLPGEFPDFRRCEEVRQARRAGARLWPRVKRSENPGIRNQGILSPRRRAACSRSPSSVAVGTAIADRPPHRSVRAALPHTALTLDSGIEACFTSRTPRNPWDTDFPALCRARVEFHNVLLGPRSSLHHLRRVAGPLCSAASSVLQRGPTPQRRACPACGLTPSRTGPLYGGTPLKPPGSRACCFSCLF